MKRYQMLIGGEWVDAEARETFETENPFLGAAWAFVPRAKRADGCQYQPQGDDTGCEPAASIKHLREKPLQFGMACKIGGHAVCPTP